MSEEIRKVLTSILLVFSVFFIIEEVYSQKIPNTFQKTPRISSDQHNKDSKSTAPSVKSSHSNISPINLTLAFAQARYDYPSERYGRTQGAFIKTQYEWLVGSSNRFKLLYSYFANRESVFLTPTIESYGQNIEQDSEESLGQTSAYPSLNRPQSSQQVLGWTQDMSLGVQWQTYLLEDDYLAISVGMKSDFIDKLGPSFSPWICLESQWRHLWLSLNYQGDPCMAMNQTLSRFLIGLNLGRAKLGLGWGMSERKEQIRLTQIDLKDGGALAWLSLPLNAAIYLEMSLVFTEAGSMLLDGENESGSYSAFMVGLTWTGEQEIKELEAPQKTSNQPGMPNLPRSPSQPSQTPQSQPLFTPSPLQPNSAPRSPNTPNTPL